MEIALGTSGASNRGGRVPRGKVPEDPAPSYNRGHGRQGAHRRLPLSAPAARSARGAALWRRRAIATGCVTAHLALATPVGAHGLGASQLELRTEGARVVGSWSVPTPDARVALGLDPHAPVDEGRDVLSRQAALRAYLVERLRLEADGAPCSTDPAGAAAEWVRDQDSIRLGFASTCPAPPERLAIECDLLFDTEPTHRAYFSVVDDRAAHLGVFRSEQRTRTVDVRYFHPVAGFVELVREGIRHIATGWDHVVFLATLLLRAPLSRTASGWAPRAGLGAASREALKVATAFTLAHSLTLCLSFLGFVSLPTRWTEAGIAASIFAAAWNNVRPFLPGKPWMMALAFGLVHGLGFAGALRNLSLPTHARGLALAAFNTGVEIGQLVIIALVLPLLYAGSRRRAYPRLVMGSCSLAIAWLGAMCTLQRALG